MFALDNTKLKNAPKQLKNEEKINGLAVSRGLAFGKAICLHGGRRQFYRVSLINSQISAEVKRFRSAITSAARQLKKISSPPSAIQQDKKSDIFSAHLMMLEDKSLHTAIENIIVNQKVNAEWAVKVITDNHIARFKSFTDEHLRNRHTDLEDVTERILTALGGSKNSVVRLSKNSIIVAKEVKPSTLIELAKSRPQAIVTENGGWTSHTFILAREMGLPAVTGVKRVLRQIQNGDDVIVDGYSGELIVNPIEKTAKNFTFRVKEFNRNQSTPPKFKESAIKTLDSQEIVIKANLDTPNGYEKAVGIGAKGIGLFRSEFLFNQAKGFPSEIEQIDAYRKIAECVGDEAVNIRTFDLGIEQLLDITDEKEKNPALGLRAVRLGFARTKQFRMQLRALLRAAPGNNIRITLPMISDVAEIAQAKVFLQREKDALRRKKIQFGELKIGAMIEVPSAVLTIDEIADEVDFLCLGTNDLVQYLLAVDRDNASVADWFRTLHPAVLRALKMVLKAAENKGKPVIICGEMAGSPVYVPILLGLGARELSMNVNSIARVRRVVSGIALEEARELIRHLDDCRTPDAVEDAVEKFYQKNWSHLFPQKIFPPKKK